MLHELSFAKQECFYHAALIISGMVNTGTKKADEDLTELLQKHGNFRAIFENEERQHRLLMGITTLRERIEQTPDFRIKRTPTTPALYIIGKGQKIYVPTLEGAEPQQGKCIIAPYPIGITIYPDYIAHMKKTLKQ